MMIVISPAKTLDLSEETRYTRTHTLPRLLTESERLVEQLQLMDAHSLGALMNISPSLAELNVNRYQTFHTPFTPSNAKQALLMFNGDVYAGLDLAEYQDTDYQYAQGHVRILSGLYGLLRPLDLIQPYRLEMGTKLQNERGKNLYDFWGDRITNLLRRDMEEQGDPTLINLASQEYFKSVQPRALGVRVITPQFKEIRDGQARIIALFAKQARGLMCNYAIREQVTDVESLKSFQGMGYQYDESLSSLDTWVFTREQGVG